MSGWFKSRPYPHALILAKQDQYACINVYIILIIHKLTEYNLLIFSVLFL